jgi:hypothetical protein
MHGEHAPRCDPRPEPTHHTAHRAGAKLELKPSRHTTASGVTSLQLHGAFEPVGEQAGADLPGTAFMSWAGDASWQPSVASGHHAIGCGEPPGVTRAQPRRHSPPPRPTSNNRSDPPATSPGLPGPLSEEPRLPPGSQLEGTTPATQRDQIEPSPGPRQRTPTPWSTLSLGHG